jgi:hypothetical protein
MGVFHVEIFQRGAAFGEEGDADAVALETSRILREVSDRVRSGRTEGVVNDYNGAPVCTYRTEVDD